MRRTIQDIQWLALVLVAAACLAGSATAWPHAFPRVAAAVTLAGYLLTTLVGLFALGGDVRRAVGVVPLLGGLTLLAAAVSIGFLPRGAAGTERLAGELGLVLQATGSLGIAVGFLVWMRGMREEAARAAQAQRDARDTMSNLAERVKDQAHRLHQTESVDEVSGALNERTFLRRLDEVVRRASRVRKPFVFLRVDLSNLRTIEAAGGAREAERALREVGDALQAATRATDFVGRLGKHEFGVVLGECESVDPVIDRLFVSFAPGLRGSAEAVVQVRIGSVSVEDHAREPAFDELYRIAGEALETLPSAGVRLWAGRALAPPSVARTGSFH